MALDGPAFAETGSVALTRVTTTAAAFTIAIGLLVLGGWSLDSELLKALVPGSVAMKVNTALAFVAFGAGLAFIASRGGARARAAGYSLVAGAVVLAAVTGSQYLFGADWGIDHVIVREEVGAAGTVHPGRMSPFTTLAFVMLGAAVLFAAWRRSAIVIGLVAFTELMAAFNILDKLFDATVPTFLAAYSQMAVNTSFAFVALGVGVLGLLPRGGPLSIFFDSRPAALLSRRFAIAAVVIPITLAWLRLMGERAGLYDTAYGVAVTTIATISGFFVVTWLTARAVDRAERQREKAVAAVRETERLLHAILDNSPPVIFIKDVDGRYVFINRAYERLWQVERSTFLGRTDREMFPPELAEAFIGNDLEVMTSGRARELENDLVTPGGTRTFLSVKFPLADLAGEAYAVCGIATDITERKLNERRMEDLSEELARSNAELEAFATVASHDLQEPLRKIQAFGDRLANRLAQSDDAEAADDLGRIVGAARRMSRLIQDLLLYSRVASQPAEAAAVDLRRTVEEVETDLEARIAETGAAIEVGELPSVTGNWSQLRQVFQNLIGNALKFTVPGRRPVVEIGSVQTRAGDGASGWTITVSDNGVGFDQKYADRIFTPFQRLHRRDEYEGTGMGLAICRKIVERHGGTISVLSTLNAGTTFSVWLPAAHGVPMAVRR